MERKNRHNINEARIVRGVHSGLKGWDEYFMFTIEANDHTDGISGAGLDIDNLFGTNSGGNSTDELQFNWAMKKGNKYYAFDHNGLAIDSINDAFKAPAIVNGVNGFSTDIDSGDLVEVYIKGQFGSLYYFDGITASPTWGATSEFASENFGNDEYELKIMQWGRWNTIKNLERFGKAHNGDYFVIEAKDEPVLSKDGVNMHRAFEDAINIFSYDAEPALASWDSNNISNGGRVFEQYTGFVSDGALNNWSFSGGMGTYAFYMRQNKTVDNGGANMRNIKNISGWAGYASEALSDSFQGSTGVHNWEKLNTGKVLDAQYYAWDNTRAKSLGTQADWDMSSCTNFTAMFGYTGKDSQGAEGELLIDPSGWDLSSAKTLFYMFGMEATHSWTTELVASETSSWNGRLPLDTMTNVEDIHSLVKNRSSFDQDMSGWEHSGNVCLFRSAFAGTSINFDFSNWDFSGVDARRTDITYNENNSSGIMGGFVRNCKNMSYTNLTKLMVALDRPFGQGGLPVLGVDPEIGTASQTIDFGISYEERESAGELVGTTDEENALDNAFNSLESKGWTIAGMEWLR